MGSVVLPHLVTGWHVDQAIMSEDERLVVIRFGKDWDPDCMRQDEVLYRIADRVKNFAVIYVCDLEQVKDFNQMYELYDTMTLMFFFRNKHMVNYAPSSLMMTFRVTPADLRRCVTSGREITTK
jgi:DIM1 family U5 snRNP protein